MSKYLTPELCIRAMDNVGNEKILNYQQLKSTRKSRVVALRCVCLRFIYNNFSLTIDRIGQLFGKHHSTIIHHLNPSEKDSKYPDIKEFTYDFQVEIKKLLIEAEKTSGTKKKTSVPTKISSLRDAIEIGIFNPQTNLPNEQPHS